MRPFHSSVSLPNLTEPREQYHGDDSNKGIPVKPKESVPFRLPKIHTAQPLSRSAPSRDSTSDRAHTGCGGLYKTDYGSGWLEKYLQRMKKLPGPPYTMAQLQRQESIHMPTFQRAKIQPALPYKRVQESTENAEWDQSIQRMSLSTKDTLALPALSESSCRVSDDQLQANTEKRTTWRLSPHQHKNYDAQAIKGQTGPFSRDFIIHCNTPNSWLRMKLERQKTGQRQDVG